MSDTNSTVIDQSQLPPSNLSDPEVTFTPPSSLPESDFASIVFFHSADCHGGGSNGAIGVNASEFTDNLCASHTDADDANGTPNFIDLEDNGASFFIKGNISGCQLHWYTGVNCEEGTHVGFMGGGQQEDGCMKPLDESGNPVARLRSFSYVCDGEDVD